MYTRTLKHSHRHLLCINTGKQNWIEFLYKKKENKQTKNGVYRGQNARCDRTRNRNAKQTNSYSSCGCEKETEAKTLLEKRLKPRDRGRLETAMFVKVKEKKKTRVM